MQPDMTCPPTQDPSALPKKTLEEEDADFICVGEGLITNLKLANTLKTGENNYNLKGLWYKKNGEIIANGLGDVIKNLDSLPFIAWDLMNMDIYRAHNWQCFHDLKSRKPMQLFTQALDVLLTALIVIFIQCMNVNLVFDIVVQKRL